MLRRCTTQGGLFRHFALRSMASNAPSNSMEILKALREKTGAPIVDVKKSLTACAWDPGTYPHAPDSFKFPTESLRSEIGGDGPELAFQELRKRGLAAVGKKVRLCTFGPLRSTLDALSMRGCWVLASSLRVRQQRGCSAWPGQARGWRLWR
jgi:hypothetical protein